MHDLGTKGYTTINLHDVTPPLFQCSHPESTNLTTGYVSLSVVVQVRESWDWYPLCRSSEDNRSVLLPGVVWDWDGGGTRV